MPVIDLVPARRPAIYVRPRPAHGRVEPAVQPRREGRKEGNAETYARALPPLRGRHVDVFA